MNISGVQAKLLHTTLCRKKTWYKWKCFLLYFVVYC